MRFALVSAFIVLLSSHTALAIEPEPLVPDALALSHLDIRSRADGLAVALTTEQVETLRLSLMSPSGSTARAQVVTINPGIGPVSVTLDRPVGKTPDPDLRLLVETVGVRPAKAWITLVAAYHQAPRVYTFGDTTLRPNTSYAPRVVVRSHAAGCHTPPCEVALAGADIDVALLALDQKGKTKPTGISAHATSDPGGSAPLTLTLGDLAPGDYQLVVQVHHPDGDAASSSKVSVVREAKVLMSTDKPIYQPGQKIYIRLLVRETGSGHAAAAAKTTVAVYDAKNNKIFQKKGAASNEGVFATELAIASMVNTGRWRIEATVDGTKVELSAERGSYRPGELVKGTISGRYFFGEPLRKAKVHLSAETFDVSASELVTMDLVLDQTGATSFELRLPDALVGLPMTNGAATVRLVATVTDTAGQTQDGQKTLAVYQQPLQIVAMPEAGNLVPGVTNVVYFVVTTPDGAPAPNAMLTLSGPVSASLKTDSNGIAELRFVPTGATAVNVVAHAPDGSETTATVALAGGDKNVLLRPSDTAPKAGDQVSFEIFVSHAVPHAFLDLIKDGQTIVTLSAPITNGRATIAATLPPELAGTVLAHAYVIGDDMSVHADTRPLVVRMADELNVVVTADKARWKPGEEATLDVAVTDRQGHPVLAALGLWAVDEAVFALSELRPGMEQVFFLLEQEIMRPKVEIHAFEPDAVFIFDRRDGTTVKDPLARSRAASVLSAAAMPTFDHALALDSQTTRAADSSALWNAELVRRARPLKAAVKQWVQDHWREPRGKDIHRALASAGVTIGKTRDAFGVPYRLSVEPADYEVGDAALMSAGPDTTWGTADDLTVDLGLGAALDKVWQWQAKLEEQRWRAQERGGMAWGGVGVGMAGVGAGGGGMGFRGEGGIALEGRAMAPPRDAQPSTAARRVVLTSSSIPTGSETAAPPRVREYFPETLLVEPLLLTDASGHAQLKVPLADSITTWRLSALASTADGRLGSMSRGLEVFQDFFVDIAFPVSLTRGDEVTVPVAVYNYLPSAQTVKLVLAAEGGLEVRGPPTMDVSLAPGEVKGVQVPLSASKVGMGRLTVSAVGAQMSDAVRREVKVEADGFPTTWTENGMLNDKLSLSVTVPPDAIADASTLQIKLFPGMFAQVMDGLEGMLRMPSGCFEQTSSSTFPNILVLQYLRDAKKTKPELEATALGYLQAGWQRLVTFEVPGGGFSWFGQAPANQVLTAYGIMEFHDMNKVYPIDQAVIARTRKWLASQQKSDGSWDPDKAFLHQESWGDMQKSTLLVSAYITWSLAQSRPDRAKLDGSIDKGLDYLRKHLDQATDAYVLDYLGNALAEAAADRTGGDRATLHKVLDKLASLAVRDGDKLHFPTAMRTATYGSGESATIEITALALRAFMRAGEHLDLVKPGLAWLVDKKSELGQWSTTQATVQVLQSMIASLSTAQEPVSGSVAVVVNGEQVATAAYTPDDFDVVRFVDASKSLKAGKNTVELIPSAGLKAMFQATATSYRTWNVWYPKDRAAPEAFHVDVAYDKANLAKNDVVGVTVTVRSNLPGVASMGIIDVAVPPGFEVLGEDLEAAVANKTLQRFSLAGRQIILYVDELRPDQPFQLKYRVRARFPVKASTGASMAYEYYNPDNVGVGVPGTLVVK